MSAQDTIRKQREQNAVMAALLKRATGETLSAEDRALLAEFAKARQLEQALRERYDLAGAIEKALRRPARAGVVVKSTAREGKQDVQPGLGAWIPDLEAMAEDAAKKPHVRKRFK
jgi:hypothetical protein